MLKSSLLEPSALMPTYGRLPIEITKGKGSYVWDAAGTKYLDFTSGIATCNLGHVPEGVKDKLHDQLETLWHCSNLYCIPLQEQLAQKLVGKSCFDKAFFCNSGAEANEAAIKLARRYANKVKKTEAFEIVTFQHSFHGRTMATLSATGQKKIHDGFDPLLKGFNHLPYNDFEAFDRFSGKHTCAVLLELIQGEGGVNPADFKWVKALEKKCRAEGIFLMVDEIQTGIGRTGTLFAYEQYDIEPDVMTLAKGLGSGFPIGAMLAKEEAAKGFVSGSHGSTFGGNPLAATAGVATLEAIERRDLISHVQEMGSYLKGVLEKLKETYPEHILEIKGKGLLLGMVTAQPAHEIVSKAREEQHLLLLTAGSQVVRILPPLTTIPTEIMEFEQALAKIFQNL